MISDALVKELIDHCNELFKVWLRKEEMSSYEIR
jgi:hypothetical protein